LKKSVEKIGQLLNYEKLSNIRLLELPNVEKKEIPNYINCPKYERAKDTLDSVMERYTAKVERCDAAIRDSHDNIEMMKKRRDKLDPGSGSWVDTSDAQAVARYNDRLDQTRKMQDKIDTAIEKHKDLIDKRTEAQEEANEKLMELTNEALLVIDKDIVMVLQRCVDIIDNLVNSEDIEEIIAAIDICLIMLRIFAMFEDKIEDSNSLKDCKECITKANPIFATLCINQSVQSYFVDIYRRNLGLVQTNAGIYQQLTAVLNSVDQGQLSSLIQSVNAVLAERIDTNFNYNSVINPDEINAIVDKIKNTINVLNQSIVKAKKTEASTAEFAKTAVNTNRQAETLRASMKSNVDALDGPLMQNHFAAQMIEEAVIDGDFYQKDLRVAVTELRRYIVDAIGAESLDNVLSGGDDRFSLKKAHNAIEKANLIRLQVALEKIPSHVKGLTDQITGAESDILRASEVPKRNADKLGAELNGKYTLACIPVLGCIFALGIHNKVKTFESAFRSTNRIYKDLGSVLLEKNKKMTNVVMVLGAILGAVGLIAFFALGFNLFISIVVITSYGISTLVLFQTGKKLQSFLGSFPTGNNSIRSEASTSAAT
jgi:hypothetical protein